MLFLALLITGCSSEGGSGGGGGGTAGIPAEITFRTFNNTVAIDGVITITATITDSSGNNVADETAVTLSDAKDLVTITPASQNTVDGQATFVITGDVAGQANLICQAGGAIATISLTVVDTAPQITLTTENNNVTVGGTTEIVATVTESDGTLVADDTEIKFEVSDDQRAELDETTVLTTDGVATVTLTARESGTVYVGATYGAGTGTLEITIQAQGTVSPAMINLTASSASISMGTTTMITATVTGSGNQTVSDGTSVAFTLDSDIGSLSVSNSLTSNGIATTTLTGDKYGTVTITAQAGSAIATTTISVTADVDDLSIATSQTTVKTDNADYAVITVTAQDQNRVPVVSVPISFTASAGLISERRVITNENGEAQIIFKSGTDVQNGRTNQVVTITASTPTPGSMSAQIPVRLVGSTLTLQINNTSLEGAPSSTTTDMTVTARDAGGLAVYLAEVTISQNGNTGGGSVLFRDPGATTGGTSTYTGTTDVSGNIVVTVYGDAAGNNVPVTITGSGLGTTASLDVTVSGEAFEFQEGTPIDGVSTGPRSDLTYNDANPDTIDRVAGSFSGDGIASGDVIKVTDSALNDGYYIVDTTGVGTMTLDASAMLATEGPAASGTITQQLAPTAYTTASEYIAGETKSLVFLGVQSPDGNDVQISTTVGTLHVIGATTAVSGNGTAVLTATPATVNGHEVVEFVLATTANASVATLRAEDVTNTAVNDNLKVAVAAPSSEASQIDIQANPTAIPTSSGGVQNISNLTITVKNAGDEVVSGAPIFITLEDTTGGGEYVSPALVYSDINGQAQATLYSGSLNSDSLGIRVIATLLDIGANDSIRVVIGGTPSSVSIGAPTEVEEVSPSLYRKPMSVVVADSNGNPVNGATVNLSVWPLGYFVGLTVDPDGPLYWSCVDNLRYAHSEVENVVYYPNEDTNRNEILDYNGTIPPSGTATIDEDNWELNPFIYPAHNNGVLDPPKSSAGTVPTSVVTDENGVAEFDYYQQKIYSTWTKVEIKASVVVYGSETIAILPYGPGFASSDKTNLPNSPWGGNGTPGECPP